MSPSPTSRADAGLAGLRQIPLLRKRVARAWSGARGRLHRHVVHVHAKGVLSWRVDAGAAPADAAERAAAYDSFAHWCAEHPGADARLQVSGQLVHSLAVDASLQLRSPDAVRRYAQQQFTHYHGPQAAAWPVAIWAEGTQSVACGLHGIDLEAMRHDAAGRDVRLLGMTPVWSAGLTMLAAARPDFAGPGRHALLLVEGAAATWLVAEDGVVTSIRQRYADEPHVDAVAQLLAALASEGPPLAAPPTVLGWGIEAPHALPAEIASTFGDLRGHGSLSDLMLLQPRRRP